MFFRCDKQSFLINCENPLMTKKKQVTILQKGARIATYIKKFTRSYICYA